MYEAASSPRPQVPRLTSSLDKTVLEDVRRNFPVVFTALSSAESQIAELDAALRAKETELNSCIHVGEEVVQQVSVMKKYCTELSEENERLTELVTENQATALQLRNELVGKVDYCAQLEQQVKQLLKELEQAKKESSGGTRAEMLQAELDRGVDRICELEKLLEGNTELLEAARRAYKSSEALARERGEEVAARTKELESLRQKDLTLERTLNDCCAAFCAIKLPSKKAPASADELKEGLTFVADYVGSLRTDVSRLKHTSPSKQARTVEDAEPNYTVEINTPPPPAKPAQVEPSGTEAALVSTPTGRKEANRSSEEEHTRLLEANFRINALQSTIAQLRSERVSQGAKPDAPPVVKECRSTSPMRPAADLPADSTMPTLRRELEEKAAECDALKTENHRLIDALRDLQSQAKALQEEVVKLTSDSDDASEAALLHQANSELRQELVVITEQAEVAKRELLELKSSYVDALSAARDEQRATIANLEREHSEALKQNSLQKLEMQDLRRQLEDSTNSVVGEEKKIIAERDRLLRTIQEMRNGTVPSSMYAVLEQDAEKLREELRIARTEVLKHKAALETASSMKASLEESVERRSLAYKRGMTTLEDYIAETRRDLKEAQGHYESKGQTQQARFFEAFGKLLDPFDGIIRRALREGNMERASSPHVSPLKLALSPSVEDPANPSYGPAMLRDIAALLRTSEKDVDLLRQTNQEYQEKLSNAAEGARTAARRIAELENVLRSRDEELRFAVEAKAKADETITDLKRSAQDSLTSSQEKELQVTKISIESVKLQQELAATRETVSMLEKKISGLSEEKSSLNAEIQRLEKTLREAEQAIEKKWRKELDDAFEEIKKVSSELAEAKKGHTGTAVEHDREINTLRVELDQVKRQLTAQQVTGSLLEERNNELANQLRGARSAVEETRASVKALEEPKNDPLVEEARQQVEALTRQNLFLERQVSELHDTLARQTREFEIRLAKEIEERTKGMHEEKHQVLAHSAPTEPPINLDRTERSVSAHSRRDPADLHMSLMDKLEAKQEEIRGLRDQVELLEQELAQLNQEAALDKQELKTVGETNALLTARLRTLEAEMNPLQEQIRSFMRSDTTT